MKKTHLKWIYRSLFIAISLSIVVVFQNCAPANFVQTDSLSSTSGTGEDPYGNDPYGGPPAPSGNDPFGTGTVARNQFFDVTATTIDNKVKLLIVVDNSTSMTASKEQLSKQVNSLITSLKGRDIEVAITTVWFASNRSAYESKYFNSAGTLITPPKSANGLNIDWSGYVGQTIKQVYEYKPPALLPLKGYGGSGAVSYLGAIYGLYGLPDCSQTMSYACNKSDVFSKVSYINSLRDKTSFSFSKNMNTEQFDILSNAVRVLIEKLPAKSTCTEQGSNCSEAYEKGLCVISSYLSDKSSSAFLSPTSNVVGSNGQTSSASNKIGVVVVSDEDDSSGKINDCNQYNEKTFKIENRVIRAYYGKFKSIIPLGGDATLRERTLKYNVDQCSRKVSVPIEQYDDGVYVGTIYQENTEYSSNLPCAAGWTTISTPYTLNYYVLTDGTYGTACTPGELAARPPNVPANAVITGCNVTTPYYYAEFNLSGGKEIMLQTPQEMDPSSLDLCKPFVSQGTQYSGLLDYNYKVQFGSASFLAIVAGSCRYEDMPATIGIAPITEVIKPIFNEAMDFGPALASISKNRYGGAVYITSIVNTDNSCIKPGSSQKIGAAYIALSNSLGSNARSSSICSTNYSDPLASLANQVTTVQKQFALTLAAGEKVISVTIIGNGSDVIVPRQDFGYANGYLTVNSNALVAGTKIQVGIGK